jgi:hypothetical protein
VEQSDEDAESALSEMENFVTRLNRRNGAGTSVLLQSEALLGKKLPAEYSAFLTISNGGEGFVGNSYVIFWPVQELSLMNNAYEVQEYAPGLLIFGSDGGGEAYGFDTRSKDWPIVQIPFVGMAWELARPAGNSFTAFLQLLQQRES